MQEPSITKVCVVGLGHWGPNIVRSIESHPQAKVVYGIEPSAERRALVKSKIPNLKVYEKFEECLNDDELDAVVIATPTDTHYQLGMQALNAGKHLMIEKPLAHNSNACLELVELAQQRQRILMTGHVFLFNQGVVEMKRIVDSGELGELLYMRSIRTNLGPIRSDVNALWDLASHDISIFNYIYGDTPREVSCSAFPILGRKVEDIAQASLIYPGNRIAAFFVSWLDPEKKREITAVGDKKMLTFNDMNPTRPITIFDKGVKVSSTQEYADTFQSFRMSIHEGNVTEPGVTTGEPLKAECNHFIDCIREGRQPITDGKNGLEVVSVLEALTRSLHENGKPISLWRSS